MDHKIKPQIRKRLGNHLLFYIQRSIDSYGIVYRAVRQNDVLVPPFIDISWIDLNNFQQLELHETLKTSLFGFTCQQEKHGIYNVRMNINNRSFKIHLKKSGACVAKGVIDNKMSKITHMYVDMHRNALSIPVVTGLTLYGVHKKRPVSEYMEITESMRNQVQIQNITNLVKNTLF